LIAKSHRWQKTIMAAASAAFLGLYGFNAAALSLGRISVQSALGEPLRAEIEILDINAEEAASLVVGVPSPDAFRAAGLEYNPAMNNLKATLQRRTDGRAFLTLRSERSVNDPFVDMILEAKWATGRIVRDYTLLFDPAGLRQTAPIGTTPSQIPAQSGKPAPANRANLPGARSAAAPTPLALEPSRSASSKRSSPAQGPSSATDESQVSVKPGDTAGKIAAAIKPANVSLDQMLVALLRANPQAFVNDNVNRIKAGAILNAPTAEQIQQTSAAQATQIIIAQSKDFNDFRRGLASSAPKAQVAAAQRAASGKIQTQVQDKKPAPVAPDKLTLSKGALKSSSAEDQAAKTRSAKDAADRAAEISKNLSELNKLGTVSSAVAASRPAAPTPGVASFPAPAVSATSAPRPVAAVAGIAKPNPAPATPTSAPIPAASTVSKIAPAGAMAQAEPGLIDELLDNPLAPAGAAGLIALLAGLGWYRYKQRKKAAQADSAFLESHLQPDSFFGASGGQNVDTNDHAATGTSMVYSPSQLDAVDDVDPVAEADVYLAYGRDLQAEEILKDALRSNPSRIAIHRKLLDIFAKRRDTKAFESTATLAFKVCKGEGADWEHICALGFSIDPDNVFYQPGGEPNNPDGSPSRPAALDFHIDAEPENDTQPQTTQIPEPAPAGVADLDLDLDFSIDETPVAAAPENKTRSNEVTPDASELDTGAVPLDLDFGLDTQAIKPFPVQPIAGKIEPARDALPELVANTAATGNSSGGQPAQTSSARPDLGMLEFDLGSLSLDLEEPAKPATAPATAAPSAGEQEDPLATKLALAQEFRSIGDDDGARALIEEVISEASGDMKIAAQRALSQL
jgi:pilus assembly protein FimV